MSTSKTLIAVFAVLGLVGLIAFTAQGSGRSLLAKVDASETEVWNNFQNFMKNHNKTYSSVQEMQDRFKIFHDNYYWVKVQNTRNLNTQYGINHFSDLTQQEFNDQYLGYLFNPDLQVEYGQESNIILADSIDWEQKGAVAPVKNQAQCGSCWSFSAVAALEGAYYQKTGKLATFSEQQLVDCSGSYGNQGCNGGLMNNAFKYWESYAAETESSYPYQGTDGTCRFDSSKGVVKVSDYKSVWPSESSLAKAVNERVVSVAVDATNWKNYAGGIFDGECSTLTLNHGVTLVGYGTDNGQDYWRIKNSWTTSWGDNGYIRLKRTNSAIGWGQCGVARQASYPILA